MNLPEELVVIILVQYHGGFSYRNGKLMNRIQSEDQRWKMLKKIVPHPNKHLTKWGDVCVDLHISEMKHYKLQLYYIDLDWREDPQPCISLSLWTHNTDVSLYSPLYNKIDLIL